MIFGVVAITPSKGAEAFSLFAAYDSEAKARIFAKLGHQLRQKRRGSRDRTVFSIFPFEDKTRGRIRP